MDAATFRKMEGLLTVLRVEIRNKLLVAVGNLSWNQRGRKRN